MKRKSTFMLRKLLYCLGNNRIKCREKRILQLRNAKVEWSMDKNMVWLLKMFSFFFSERRVYCSGNNWFKQRGVRSGVNTNRASTYPSSGSSGNWLLLGLWTSFFTKVKLWVWTLCFGVWIITWWVSCCAKLCVFLTCVLVNFMLSILKNLLENETLAQSILMSKAVNQVFKLPLRAFYNKQCYVSILAFTI